MAREKPQGTGVEADQEKRIAREIFRARSARETFKPLRGAEEPPSLACAYRIQDEVDRLFQAEGDCGPLGGHKVALTSQAVQELCGVDQPAYGSVLARSIRQSPAKVSLSSFCRLGLEFEVAFRIGRDVPAQTRGHDRESLAPFVESCMPAFELIDDRNADYSDLDAASILTDRCWCGGVVLGTAVTDWQALDLAGAAGELTWNGDVIDRGFAGDAMGHPCKAWSGSPIILGRAGKAFERATSPFRAARSKRNFPSPAIR